jgi:hypothetical protein
MTFSISNTVNPETLIGTKWISAEAALNDKNTLEIIDKAYCIYSSLTGFELNTYKIIGDEIFIGDSACYVINDNILFHNNTPLFIKE